MAKKKSIGVVFGILVISAWLGFTSTALVLFAGSVTPAVAGQPTIPVWTLTEQVVNTADQKHATLHGVVPTVPRNGYAFTVLITIGKECYFSVDCANTTCDYDCPAGLKCIWESISVNVDPSNPQITQDGNGTGWYLTVTLNKSYLELSLFLPADPVLHGHRYLQVSVSGDPLVAGYPRINTGTNIYFH